MDKTRLWTKIRLLPKAQRRRRYLEFYGGAVIVFASWLLLVYFFSQTHPLETLAAVLGLQVIFILLFLRQEVWEYFYYRD